MTPEHSSLPWGATEVSVYSGADPDLPFLIADTRDSEHGLSEANAEFIVTACNSHYQLVEALKALNTEHLRMRPNHEKLDRAWRKAETALKLARGEERRRFQCDHYPEPEGTTYCAACAEESAGYSEADFGAK